MWRDGVRRHKANQQSKTKAQLVNKKIIKNNEKERLKEQNTNNRGHWNKFARGNEPDYSQC